MNAILVHTILSSAWLMDGDMANNYLPVVFSLLKGENVRLNEEQINRAYAYKAKADQKIQYRNFNQAPVGSIAVHPIRGVILKNDGLCTTGTETMMRRMAEADESPNIVAHILDIDSGGGEGTNIETMARFIRNSLQKPVIAHINGYAASAAYYIAAAADEVYTSQKTDKVGSVGALVSFYDFSGYLEKEGIKLHEIYASQSDLKNSDFKDAKKGDYKSIRSKLLDPLAAQFIEDIKMYRPGTIDPRIFRGDIFTAKEGIELKMVDGIKTFQEAVDRAILLSNKSKEDMEHIQSNLGYSKLETDSDGGLYLHADDVAKLNAKLGAKEATLEETATSLTTEEYEDLLTTLEAQDAKIVSLSERVSELQALAEGFVTKADFDAFKAKPAATETSAFSEGNPNLESKKDAADDLEEATNKAAMSGGIYFE